MLSLTKLLSVDDLAFLRSLAMSRSFADGEILHDRGDGPPALCLVEKGRVKLVNPRSNGRESFVAFIDAGQHYGDIVLFDGGVRTHRAVAMGQTIVAKVPCESFALVLARPTIVEALYRVAAMRMMLVIDMLDDMRVCSPEARLGKLLLLIQANAGGGETIDFLQDDIANMLGVSLMTLAKGLKLLKQEGLIETGYRRIAIPDSARLAAWIREQDPD